MVFFEQGRVYRHFEDGRPSELGVFVVAWVGRAPAGFEVPEQTCGVAFGWRRTVTAPTADASGGEPAGAYMTCDPTGWHEVTDSELAALLPSPIPEAAWRPHPRGQGAS
ncbi:hypothetical protein [Kitasatospora sp. NPDC051914]|uniref:hypothetical protein n=1 Tax=Kitasatospora sp. NPDC051914 TaxID=3154945 RepID=UPI0034321D41